MTSGGSAGSGSDGQPVPPGARTVRHWRPGAAPDGPAPTGEGPVEDALTAYDAGRADALAGSRDATRAAHPATGADYRTGFLDGRLEIFRMFSGVRRYLEGSS